MGPDESFAFFALMMGGGSIVIALTMMVQKMHGRRLAFRQRQMELDAEVRIATARSTEAGYVERLEHRVRVLERIATDKNAALAHDIEALRERA
ncbi:hypothetical protein ACOYW6_03090 [Parablastomonas sp. CN1-191]|uniref:hypothetical protein n=1 Tax=Parablastomonas sp. CN1-191 TaxID=3400908 RepID=UPI003BF8DB9C